MNARAALPDDLALEVLPLPAASKATFEDFQPRAGIMADPEWHTWCPSVIRGADGRFHLFHSRWPRSTTFNGWLVHSEVAHAVADHPAGPFAHVATALSSRGAFPWDATTAHNPKIERFAGRFYLYFCSTHGETNEARLLELSRTGAADPLWMPIRNHQRTGVAVADSLGGPWRVSEQPIVEPAGPITRLTVNPAVCQGPDGTYFMIVKGDSPTAKRRNQALATSPKPEGPFTIQPQPVIDDLDTEDCSLWYDARRQRFYAVFHAHTFIGMMTSADGYHWNQAAQYQLTTRRVRFDDGSFWDAERMERPFVLADATGQLPWLYVAVKKGDRSYDLALPLRIQEAKPPGQPASSGASSSTQEPSSATAALKVPRSAIERGLEWRGVVLEEPDFTLWDVSPIRDAEGKVHLFVGRWPEKNVDPAWRKSSEIAHYIGDTPEGPFHFHDVALRGSGTNTWDQFAPHNPEVRQFGETYALAYIANDDFHQPPHPRNQCIGLALSRSLNGPWRKVGRGGLVLESSRDTNHWTFGSQVVNPTLLQVGGKFHLYFKSRCQGQPGTVYGVAIADRLEGPYRITGGPLTTKGVMIEDGFAFAWQGKVCLISTDNHGGVTGVRGGGALWVSEDGRKFNPAWTQVAYDRIPAHFREYDAQRVKKIYGGDPKLERPKLLLEDGQPAWLYAPSGWNVTGGERTVIHLLRVNLKPGDGPLPASSGTGRAASRRSRFTVMSFNILEAGGNAASVGFPDSAFGGSRRAHTAKILRECGADVVGVQECGPVAPLLKELGPDWNGFGTGQSVYAGAIVSRLPLEPLVTEDALAAARVQLPDGGSVVLVNAHWSPPRHSGVTLIQQRLRVGNIPPDLNQFEAEVLAASDASAGPRGYRHTLDLLRPLVAAGENVILTGDFNESSHLDWTARAATNGLDRWVKNPTGRPLRFKIEWKGSKQLADPGLRDAYRVVFPDEVAKPGITWTPPYSSGAPGRRPYEDQVLERCDIVYVAGKNLQVVNASIVGESRGTCEIVHAGPWPSDHRAATATFVVNPPATP